MTEHTIKRTIKNVAGEAIGKPSIKLTLPFPTSLEAAIESWGYVKNENGEATDVPFVFAFAHERVWSKSLKVLNTAFEKALNAGTETATTTLPENLEETLVAAFNTFDPTVSKRTGRAKDPMAAQRKSIVDDSIEEIMRQQVERNQLIMNRMKEEVLADPTKLDDTEFMKYLNLYGKVFVREVRDLVQTV